MLLTTTNTNFRLLPTIPTAKILSLEEWHREQLSLRAEKRLFKSATGSRRRELARSRTRKDELEDSGTEPEDERSRAEVDADREKQEEEEFFGDPPLTQQRERNVAWFTDHFLGRAHHTYLALSSPVGPLAVSIILDQHDHTYKLIIRSTRGSQRLTVPFSVVPPPSFFRRLFGYGYDPLAVLAVASPVTPQRTLRYCTDPYLPKELLAVEERQVIRSYKFGVGYVGGEIPANEESMLSCRLEQTSPAFHEFLAWLGDTVELKGWKGYRGGLDVKGE
ncbi:hypothetical protein BC938DRAFT_473971 [Jimgerdemannia flammicorona]|uniref:Rap-GAP domain-containing protein n=1 Tax=Jimgerdemannia flammicorona TaxID=994334 RepID=A0A433Q322_9FUNG|nr:hypothetical protein BC938DRAFT_473971 [Jimgerdemannia flammicorona]